jgi:hypothetical protein
METTWNFVSQNLNYVLIAVAVILSFLAGLNKSISGAIKQVWGVIVIIISFFADTLRESDKPDGTKGKVSFGRILGIYVTYNIIQMGWVVLFDTTYTISDKMMTLFWVTIGFALVSKIWTDSSPSFQALISALVTKWQGITQPPAKIPDAPPAQTTTTTTTTTPTS